MIQITPEFFVFLIFTFSTIFVGAVIIVIGISLHEFYMWLYPSIEEKNKILNEQLRLIELNKENIELENKIKSIKA